MAELADITENIIWNNKLAYAIGLLTADGNLSSDGRHMTFVSKDIELMDSLKNCLGLKNRISMKSSGHTGYKEKKYHVIQFGNITLYNF